MWGPYFNTAADLRQTRRAAGWTQKELAERAGVHVQTVKYHERKKGQISGVAASRLRRSFISARIPVPELPMRTSLLLKIARYQSSMGEADKSSEGFGEVTPRARKVEANTPSQRPRLICEALTRAGSPCKAKAVSGRCRCRMHGGLSTGPKTEAGKEKIRLAQLTRWRLWRKQQSIEKNASRTQ